MENVLQCIVIAIIFFMLGWKWGMVSKIKEGEKKLDNIVVQSIKTREKYRAFKYRIGFSGPEIQIYNHISQRYEWWSIWQFERAILLICYIDPHYALSRYGFQSTQNMEKFFTEAPDKCYNKTVKNQKKEK